MPEELIAEFFEKMMRFVIFLFAVSLPMAYLTGKKMHGWALLYLPIYLLMIGFAFNGVLHK